MIQFLNGSNVKESMISELQKKANALKMIPSLKIITAEGFNQASTVYVKNKVALCSRCGVDADVIKLNWEGKTKEEVLNEILFLINHYNADDSVNAYFFQMPLPYGIVEADFITHLNPIKDCDGFHPLHLGLLYKNQDNLTACTPAGIMELLKYYDIPLQGKDVVIVNRSQLVGIPLIPLLLAENATVQVCHSKTVGLKEKVRNADIVITAVGRANFMDSTWFKNGQTIIDVSMNRDENNKLCGDVSKKVYKSKKNLKITPVPGGVGQLTVVKVVENVIKAAQLQQAEE